MVHHNGIGPLVSGAAQRFRADLDEPGSVQAEILRSILKMNRHSEFGRSHNFDQIADAAEFAQAVPIAGYDAVATPISRMANGASGVLVSEPLLAFEQTGGSSDGAKLIPYTDSSLAAFQSGLLPWLDDLCSNFPSLGRGALYWAISPACRLPHHTPSGVPVGLPDAAYLGIEVGSVVAQMLAVPVEVGQLSDVTQWRAATLRHLFACKSLAMISVWSPSFFTELLRYAHEGCEALARDIAQADCQRASVVAEELSRATPDYQRLWPNLQVISCWDQASSAVGAATLRAAFPNVLVQGKGLLATEGLISIPLKDFAYPVLALRAGYFEFVDASGKVWGADSLVQGQEYQLLLTTYSGLYRYALGDQVVIRGFARRTPMLEFVGRSHSTSDLCGEKLCDSFVARRIAELGQPFAVLAPDSGDEGARARYALLLDARENDHIRARSSAAALDHALHDNPQYAYARQMRQLDPIVPVLCDHPLQDWLNTRLAHGQRLGDIKLPALLNTAQWKSWVHRSAKDGVA